MALSYLGEALDIHGGGLDLVFPHHENEIAQSESFTGVTPFARYWLHNGLVQLGQEKMAKSTGNLITVGQALSRYSADAIRLFILSSHYRGPLTYTEEGLEAMQRGAARLCQVARAQGPEGGDTRDADVHRRRFVEAMDDDFNTAQAIAILFDLARDINRSLEQGLAVAQAQAVLMELAGVLGLRLESRELALAAEPLIELLISVRSQLRDDRQWPLADRIRSSIGELGIVLEDTSQGTLWRYKG
jgi:cysteinyl-tRNA synthetase